MSSFSQRQAPSAAEETVEDLRRLLQILGFVLNAVRRNKGLAITVVVLTVAAAVGAFAIMPRTYAVETRILTHESVLIPALVSPTRAVPIGSNRPSKNAVEIIKSRENLKGIITEAELMGRWKETRHLIGQAKDAVTFAIKGEMSEDDLRDALIEIVDQKLVAYVEGDVVVIRIEWHTALDAVKIAEATKARFLRARKDAELAEVNETVKILTNKLTDSQRTLEDMTSQVADIIERKTGKKVADKFRAVRVRRAAPANSGDAKKIEEQKRRLERALTETTASIASLDREYQRKVQVAKEKLARVSSSLGRNHPDFQSAERAVNEASRPPPELGFLKKEEAEMRAELTRLDRLEAQEASKGGGGGFQTIQVPIAEDRGDDRNLLTDPEIERGMTELQLQIGRHNDLAQRLSEAETEVEAAAAAFQYRYQVTVPPLLPNKHIKPKAPIVLGGGLFGALFLAVVLCVLRDLLSRRVLEAWQVESLAGVPVLGVVDLDDTLPRLTSGKA